MSVSIPNCSFLPVIKWSNGLVLWVRTAITLTLGVLLLPQAFGQAFNLDQMANGKVTPPFPVSQPPSSQWTWQNGNLNRNNAHFRESHSVPYRCDLTGLSPNTVYVLRVGIDVRVGGKFALDYFTGVQNLTPHGMFGHDAEKADPLAGLTFSVTSTNDYPLPVPSGFSNTPRAGYPAASFNALTTDNIAGQPTHKQLRIYNATVADPAVDITYENPSSVDLSATTAEAILRIRFKTDAAANRVMIAWGGHIAAEFDWPGQSAQFISGSPYHCHIRNLLDDNGKELAKGSTDRSLKTDAIFRPAECTVTAAQTVCQGAASPLTYAYLGDQTGITNYKWALTTNTAGVKIEGDNGVGDSDPATGTVSGSSFSSVNIIPSSGTTFATAGSFTLALTLTNAGGASEPCTTTGTITPTPGQPTAVVKTPLCTDLTMTVEVTLPAGLSASATVTLKQMSGGASPMTQNASAAVGGKLTFTGLTFGKGYSITITDGVSTALPAGCTSTPLECGDFTGGYQNTTVNNSQSAISEQEIVLRSIPRTSVLAAPNPFNDRIRFTLKSEVSGRGSLELYNALGQRVKTVFQGQVSAGQAQTIEYAVPGSQRANLIYVFRVGSEQTTGKLIGLKQ
ncbi:MAG TPA: hypothetical protein VGE06_05535 [Flavisolibacter sp.]